MKSLNPDIVIPANYYNEYALLVRTMKQQKVDPKAIYSVLGGAASSFKFVKEFPDVADGIIDCNHWYNPRDKRALALRKAVEAKWPVLHLRDLQYLCHHGVARQRHRGCEVRRSRRDHQRPGREHLVRDTSCPTDRPRFVNGQNTGAMPLMTQVLKGDIRVIVPKEYADTAPVFPWKA